MTAAAFNENSSRFSGIEIDESRIDPARWQPVALEMTLNPMAVFPGVAARFGWQARFDEAGENGAATPSSEVDDNSSMPADVVALPEPVVRRLVRVVRKPVEPAFQPNSSRQAEAPQSAPAKGAFRQKPAMEWRKPSRVSARAANFRLDRGGMQFAIAMMIAAWAGVLAIGAYVSNTPKSGTKIEWR